MAAKHGDAKRIAGRRGDAKRSLRLRRLLAAASGARLCFGEPVEVQGRTVIPVARVRGIGGFGLDRGRDGGGGGLLDAAPVGFIDVSAQGSRFEAIPDRAGASRGARGAAATLVALAGAAVGAQALRRRRPALRSPRSPRRSLPR